MSGIDLGEPVLAHSIDPIMKELEAAIKNSYQSEYEEFAKSNTQENGGNPLPSKILDSKNEEEILEKLQELESAEEIKQFLKIEEQVYTNTFIERAKEFIFENLYRQNVKRIVTLVRVIRNQSLKNSEKQPDETEKDRLLNLYSETNRMLQKKFFNSQSELAQLKIELEDKTELFNRLNEKYEEISAELEIYRGNESLIKNMKLEDLILLEKNCADIQKFISKFKTEKLRELYSEIENMKQHQDDLRKCIICREHNACILLKPCNHANVCEDCSLKLVHCPIDRTEIISQEKIFL